MRSSSGRVTGWGEMGWAAEGNILAMEGEGPATARGSPGTAQGMPGSRECSWVWTTKASQARRQQPSLDQTRTRALAARP